LCRNKSLFVALLLCAGCGSARHEKDLHPIPRQNVLLITIDTLRADALGSYGGPAATPALDRLAAGGVRFEFAHAHAVVTLPSHASILTGRYPFQHGIRDNSGYRAAKSERTAATLLRSAGYATAAFVGAFPLHSRFGLNAGFDVYDDRFGESHAPTDFVMPERPASAVVALARTWIATASRTAAPAPASSTEHRAPGTPWFVWVHVFDPHAPYRPPAPFAERYSGQPYYGEVAATDAALAPLLDDVRALQQPTLVIVTGDHGESLGEHGEATHGLFAYEATLRVPLIISEVGGGQADATGEVSRAPVRHVDILPTMLDAIGQPVPPDLPGRSLLPASARAAETDTRPSYFEAMGGMLNRGWSPLAGVLANRDKFIDLPIAERYDLGADPAERTNLAGRDRERDRTLEAALRGFAAAAPSARVAEGADAAARLRALGYVAGRAAPKQKYTEADDPKRLVALDALVHQAVEAFAAGRIADAAATYRTIIDRRPDMAIAYRHLAFLEAQHGDLANAIAALQRGLRAGIEDPRAIAQLAGYLADSGKPGDAIQLVEPLAAAPDVEVETLNTLGIAYAQAGRLDQARRTFERLVTLNPTSSVPLENLGLLALQRGDVALARQHYRAAVAVDPRSSRAHSGLGAVASKSGDLRIAVDEWTQAVALDRNNFDALYNLGTTLARQGDKARARPYLELFLKSAPPPFEKDKRRVARLLADIP
jgi:arylsulfatase A-like enzyme/Flp pilus assembly protein TadD